MRKGRKYECNNCGYDGARWHIYVTDVEASQCERCYVYEMNDKRHVEEFHLNEQ